MAKQLESDRILFGAVVALVLFGCLMVYSASAVLAAEQFGSSYHFLLRQVFWAVLGLALMIVMMNVDYHRLASPMVVFPALAIELVMLAAVFLAAPSHNAHRWLRWGWASFQPSELAKVVTVIFLAYFLETRRREINDWKHTLAPMSLVAGATVGAIVGVGAGSAGPHPATTKTSMKKRRCKALFT